MAHWKETYILTTGKIEIISIKSLLKNTDLNENFVAREALIEILLASMGQESGQSIIFGFSFLGTSYLSGEGEIMQIK